MRFGVKQDVEFVGNSMKQIFSHVIQAYSSHSSLDEFYRTFHERIDKRYLVYTKDLKVEDKMIYLPMYMTPLI